MPLPAALSHCRFTADDWGLSPGVNNAMVDLARRGILVRISALADAPHGAYRLAELQTLPGVTMGLHFNLSYGPLAEALVSEGEPALDLAVAVRRAAGVRWEYPGSLGAAAMKWARLAARSRQRSHKAVQAHLRHQLAALRNLGVAPSYVDGHHHVHALPGMLTAMAPVLAEVGIRQIRVPYDPRLFVTFRAPLAIMGALMRGRARELGLTSLPFHYPRESDQDDAGRWCARLAALARRGPIEVLVHPAALDDVSTQDYPDSYSAGRTREYAALLRLEVPDAADGGSDPMRASP